MLRRAPLAVVSAAFGAMLWWTWGTWPDPLIDFGRELYAPWQVSLGRVLYRDIAWLSGPLSTYVNAGWFSLLGVGLHALVAGNLAFLVLLLWLVFRIVSGMACRVSATVATLACVVMSGFTISNYNFVAPYSHELTHGLILSLVAIACFAAFLKSGHLIAVGGAGLAIGLCFLTKAEVFLAVAAAFLAGLGAAHWTGAVPARRTRTILLVLAASAAGPVVIAFVLFLQVLPAAEAMAASAGAWRYVFTEGLGESVYYRRLAGLLDPADSLLAILAVTALSVAVFGAAAAGAFLSAKHLRDRVLSTGLAFGLGVGLFGAGAAMLPWDRSARALPLVMIGSIAAIALTLRRTLSQNQAGLHRSILQLTMATFALVLLARIGLNAAFYRYGFALALPAVCVGLAALITWIPARISAAGGDGPAFRAFALAGVLMVMAAHLHGASAYLAAKQFAVRGAADSRDAFLADGRAVAVNDVLAEIQQRLRPHETLAVLPEGVMLNYLARRTNPTPFITFMPPELAAYGESQMVSALSLEPPDYIALVHKDTSEYGVRSFGRDYGRAFIEWVEARYRTVRVFGAVPLRGEQFGISLHQRMETP